MNYLNSFTTTITKPLKKLYHYLFSYDEDKLSIYGQDGSKILAKLSFALLHKPYILLTYQDGSSDIGQIIKRLSPHRFVFRLDEQKILKIVNVKEILRVDFA
ncbi:hypothetical protein PT285_04875 [Lactobacillus sp. ESL0791]|uniref:hypothetical protein n=1 Tax=Lactobacillus sp. ESL0791 TaxID=2983234 RepID=UPI0023F87980|nr:hypothetical protein [Lactobacillus sp. ESL0791]MDF7638729.1 hypothetical protein [Lactobacillus sp. ESL0791]